VKVEWQAGDADLGRQVAGELAHVGEPGCRARELRDNPRRRILRVDPQAGPPLLVKQFRLGSGRHRGRERLKGWLGQSPARREWRNLLALRAEGVAVPEPLAFGRLENGDALVVMAFCAGQPLSQAMGLCPAARRVALRAVGRAVSGLHAAGFVHRDLHAGNLLVDGEQAVLLDLQNARRSLSPAGRFGDLGWLDHSLWTLANAGDRMRLRRTALSLLDPSDPSSREELRAVGLAAWRRAFDHARSRTRRSLVVGRAYAEARSPLGAGLRVRELGAEQLGRVLDAHRAALEAHDDRVLKDDARSRMTAVEVGKRRLVVKEFPARGWRRALADRFRGSAARRGWVAGHGLFFRRIGAAHPYAFLESRRLGLPFTSILLLEDQRPAQDALAALEHDPERVVEALLGVLVALHRFGVDHGDLKASHVFLDPSGEATLVDLEGVRFRARLSEAQRMRALVELNASLPDVLPPQLRRRAFTRYASAHPFREGAEASMRRVVRLSLARQHRFRGEGCRLADELRARSPKSA
jgi:tRNA A-37 threonylcarbamoyl transferase component Bud32